MRGPVAVTLAVPYKSALPYLLPDATLRIMSLVYQLCGYFPAAVTLSYGIPPLSLLHIGLRYRYPILPSPPTPQPTPKLLARAKHTYTRSMMLYEL